MTIDPKDIIYIGELEYICYSRAYILDQLNVLTKLGLVIQLDAAVWLSADRKYAAILWDDKIRIHKRMVEC